MTKETASEADMTRKDLFILLDESEDWKFNNCVIYRMYAVA
jgi:hypothetical protein